MSFWTEKYYRRAIQLLGSNLYLNPDPDLHRSILVAGTARSGTTWLGDLITAQIPSRVLFEPFNPDLVPEYRNFSYFQYMRPGSESPEFHAFAQKVFTGRIRNRWIDRQNERIFSNARLVKEIRANLALRWLHENFPEVPILFLVRHPCAVVLSRMELGWATDGDIVSFLSQPDLIEDHLAPHLDLIHSLSSDEEKHTAIWSVSNLVPLRQFLPGELKIVYYEDLCTQPEMELPGIFKTIGYREAVRGADVIRRPSQTSRKTSAVVIGTNKIGSWKNRLSRSQVDNILRVVDSFGLGNLYGDSLVPLKENVS